MHRPYLFHRTYRNLSGLPKFIMYEGEKGKCKEILSILMKPIQSMS